MLEYVRGSVAAMCLAMAAGPESESRQCSCSSVSHHVLEPATEPETKPPDIAFSSWSAGTPLGLLQALNCASPITFASQTSRLPGVQGLVHARQYVFTADTKARRLHSSLHRSDCSF